MLEIVSNSTVVNLEFVVYNAQYDTTEVQPKFLTRHQASVLLLLYVSGMFLVLFLKMFVVPFSVWLRFVFHFVFRFLFRFCLFLYSFLVPFLVQGEYHEKVVGSLCALVSDGSQPVRVRGHAASAIVNFTDTEDVPEEAIAPHLDALLSALCSCLNGAVPQSVQVCAVQAPHER